MIGLEYVVTAFLASFLMAALIVATKSFHGKLTLDGDHGIQKIHAAPTPRIGGFALLAGALVAGLTLDAQTQALWWTICLCASPAFGSGAIEDITKKVSAKWRLLATVCAGLIFCLVSGYHIERADIPGLDYLLRYPAFGIALSAIAIGGIANSLNIIDGVNGLASGSAIIVFSAFAVIAEQTNDGPILAICLLMIGSIAGFFVVNFPAGKLFYGDAGAYATGFVLAVIGIVLPARNPEISPLIAVLALAYPWIETVVSIRRRLKRDGTHPGAADRLHLHSLVYRSRAKRIAEALGHPEMRNPITSVVLWSLSLIACSITVISATSPASLGAGVGVVFVCYMLIYRRVALGSKLRRAMATARRARIDM
ncbi:glycosyl transferase family 4 [Thioclava sp. F1Mire-8]|uniref:MraY family glycosyltransferase n=1 Tax=Thioclava sp. F1Mire-8 TaxID=1973006 RepID=UPI000B53BA15|nr:glycosyltransferase [Thioclava sp. F1Mire-8]OWY05102.1 glycosyl transferase family 4 [Thioclava sp. F1Mire-8]